MSDAIERTYVDDLLEYIDTAKEEAAAIVLTDKFHEELDCIVMAHGLPLPNNVVRCNAVLDENLQAVTPCCTCARFVMRYPYSASKTQWLRPVPAFHNGTRYVCDKHMEIKNGQ